MRMDILSNKSSSRSSKIGIRPSTMLKQILFLAAFCVLLFTIGFRFSDIKLHQGTIKNEVGSVQHNASDDLIGTIPFDQLPDYAKNTIVYILKHHEPMENYEGGRIFKNRERILPQFDADQLAIEYKEWDVHPHIQGKNRGTERLITSNNKTVYWTNDHYKTFKKVLGYDR